MKKRITALAGAFFFVIVGVLSIIFGQDFLGEIGVDLPDGGVIPALPTADPRNPNRGGIASADWYEIYFTDPQCGPEETRQGGIDSIIVEDLLNAEVQVDVAAFDLDLPSIVQALIDLEEAGVVVRVVTDEDNSELSSINRLRRNGISVVEDKRTPFMHNKFVIVDGRTVWTGSMNLTENGAYCNNNNMVRIESPRLAANYLAEMDEMYDERAFGPTSPLNTPNQSLVLGGVEVENHLGPETEIGPIISRAVAAAQEEILFMAFAFTDERIGEALSWDAPTPASRCAASSRPPAPTPPSAITALCQPPGCPI
jgi:phosphatidylserine/phosphatidylglycerophosphate/cardiolipin synthase-like enzyme